MSEKKKISKLKRREKRLQRARQWLAEYNGTPGKMVKQYRKRFNDDFAFIAGYTSGGAPYGITWEEAGIDLELPFEERVRVYYEIIN